MAETSKKIERSLFIEEQFEILQTTYPVLENLYLNEFIVNNLVSSYFDDVRRYKDYHTKTEKVNYSKVAGFTAKWISKLNPVQMPKGFTCNKKEVFLVNEYLALQCATSIIGIHNIQVIDHEIIYDLIYSFRYRNVSGKMLSTVFRMMQESYL